MGYVVRQTLSTELSPAPKNVTSMINLKMIASSADPKNGSMSSSEVLSSDPCFKEKHVVHPTKKVRITLYVALLYHMIVFLFSEILTESVSFCTAVTNLCRLYLHIEKKDKTSVVGYRW